MDPSLPLDLGSQALHPLQTFRDHQDLQEVPDFHRCHLFHYCQLCLWDPSYQEDLGLQEVPEALPDQVDQLDQVRLVVPVAHFSLQIRNLPCLQVGQGYQVVQEVLLFQSSQ